MKLINELGNEVVKQMLVNIVESAGQVGARFGGLKYTNEQGETSQYNVIFGIKLESLYKSDLRRLHEILPETTGVKQDACKELIDSVTESLTKGIGNNSAYTLKDYFEPITKNGEVKLHRDEKTGKIYLYLRGYVLNKTVITEGAPHKKVNSSEKTIAKRNIEKDLKRSKIRTFKIDTDVLKKINAMGQRIEIE